MILSASKLYGFMVCCGGIYNGLLLSLLCDGMRYEFPLKKPFCLGDAPWRGSSISPLNFYSKLPTRLYTVAMDIEWNFDSSNKDVNLCLQKLNLYYSTYWQVYWFKLGPLCWAEWCIFWKTIQNGLLLYNLSFLLCLVHFGWIWIFPHSVGTCCAI